MFSRLAVSNFKTWENIDLKMGRVTGLFGPNSSGKTSIIQFFLLLKQTNDATDRALALDLGGPYVMLGTYKDFIFQHKDEASLKWSLSFEAPKPLVIPDPEKGRTDTLVAGKRIQVRSEIDSRGGAPRSRYLQYTFDK